MPAFLQNGQVGSLRLKVSQYSALPRPEDSALVRALLQLPRVWLWARPEGTEGDLCSFNHETAALLAAAHLAGRGHQRVAYLNPKQGKSSLEHLKKEFTHACAAHGLKLMVLESHHPAMTAWPEPALTGEEDVAPLVDRWLGLKPELRPTAALVPADNIAIHVCRALETRGIRLGRDLSLISCNNEKSVISALKPSLTTIEVNAARIGAQAVRQLLWRIAHPADPVTQTLLLEPRLLEGDSVAQLRR